MIYEVKRATHLQVVTPRCMLQIVGRWWLIHHFRLGTWHPFSDSFLLVSNLNREEAPESLTDSPGGQQAIWWLLSLQ